MHREGVVLRLFVIGLMVVFGAGCAADGDVQPRAEQPDVAVNESEVPVEQSDHDKRIDYIELPTIDIVAAKAFYTSVFGWKTQDWGPDYSSFEDGRLNGGFRKEAEVAPGGPLVIMFAVDLESVEAAVRSHGGMIVKEIFSFPGGRRFHFTDPSGNELAVWSDR